MVSRVPAVCWRTTLSRERRRLIEGLIGEGARGLAGMRKSVVTRVRGRDGSGAGPKQDRDDEGAEDLEYGFHAECRDCEF